MLAFAKIARGKPYVLRFPRENFIDFSMGFLNLPYDQYSIGDVII